LIVKKISKISYPCEMNTVDRGRKEKFIGEIKDRSGESGRGEWWATAGEKGYLLGSKFFYFSSMCSGP